MSEDLSLLTCSRRTRDPLAWIFVFVPALLAWAATLAQTVGMASMPMYGTMGMTLLPFLGFWTIMMAAMMLPGLAPTVSVHMAQFRSHTRHQLHLFPPTLALLLGYLFVWSAFGLFVFACCALVDQLVLSRAPLALGLGMAAFLMAGLYQFTPLKKQALERCHQAVGLRSRSEADSRPVPLWTSLSEGFQHGWVCLHCCGFFMLILVAVGLMNLFWMGVMTLVLFLEKVWVHGQGVRLWLGFLLLFYGLLAFISPGLLPGLYRP